MRPSYNSRQTSRLNFPTEYGPEHSHIYFLTPIRAPGDSGWGPVAIPDAIRDQYGDPRSAILAYQATRLIPAVCKSTRLRHTHTQLPTRPTTCCLPILAFCCRSWPGAPSPPVVEGGLCAPCWVVQGTCAQRSMRQLKMACHPPCCARTLLPTYLCRHAYTRVSAFTFAV